MKTKIYAWSLWVGFALAASLCLTGCATTPPTTLQNTFIAPPSALIMDCKAEPPPDSIANYPGLPWQQKESLWTTFAHNQYGDIASQHVTNNNLRSWIANETALYNGASAPVAAAAPVPASVTATGTSGSQ